MKYKEMTLLFLLQDNKILLALKKRGFGEGNYNGVGGKLEPNEIPEGAMLRETKEEIDVVPTEYFKVGTISFIEFYKGNKEHNLMHVYVATKWAGIPTESEEVKPIWFNTNEIPYDKMFEDDKHWLPRVLDGKIINDFFEFDEKWTILVHQPKDEGWWNTDAIIRDKSHLN